MAGLIAEGRRNVTSLIDGVEQAVAQTHESLGRIGALEQMVRRIGKIVDGINTVSIQTNMLAISGSVEAARSGDAGRGFALVSADIRNLAQGFGGERRPDQGHRAGDPGPCAGGQAGTGSDAGRERAGGSGRTGTSSPPSVAVEADMAAVRDRQRRRFSRMPTCSCGRRPRRPPGRSRWRRRRNRPAGRSNRPRPHPGSRRGGRRIWRRRSRK